MSSNSEARLGVVLGAVAVLAIPVGAALAAYTTAVQLLDAVYVAVPVAFLAGLAAVAAYRRARAELQRSVRRAGVGPVRAARWLALSGLYLGVTGALALGFYGLLHMTS
jgi:hypothetical protein